MVRALLASVDAHGIAGESGRCSAAIVPVAAAAGGAVCDARDRCREHGEPSGDMARRVRGGAAGGADDVARRARARRVGRCELFLPVEDEMFARPFRREGALAAEDVEAVPRARAPAARSAFDSGAAMITPATIRKRRPRSSARFSPMWTARRRSAISASASPPRGTTSRPPASGRRRSSTRAMCRRCTSGSAMR